MCPKANDVQNEKVSGVPLITEPTSVRLSKKQQVDYSAERRSFLQWLSHEGKNPEALEGYAKATVRRTSYDIDKFYRWNWERSDRGYHLSPSHQEADEYVRDLLYSDYSRSHCAKARKSLLRYFRWRATQGGEKWEPTVNVTDGGNPEAPQDYFTTSERRVLREASLEYADISEELYSSGPVSGSWKIPSLTWTSLDAGLRPVEVKRATVQWVDLENGVLRIPKKDSAKSGGNWTVALTDRTTMALSRWLTERDGYGEYNAYSESEDRDSLWLTRQGNPYTSQALKYVIERLCSISGIDIEHRSPTWYMIRHGLAVAIAEQRGLKAVKEQLRHKSIETTMRYDHVSVAARRDALNKIG